MTFPTLIGLGLDPYHGLVFLQSLFNWVVQIPFLQQITRLNLPPLRCCDKLPKIGGKRGLQWEGVEEGWFPQP